MNESLGSWFPENLKSLMWLVYERVSSPGQLSNEGSIAAQRGTRDVLIGLGVPPTQVILVEDDLGRSGQAVNHRAAYLRVLEAIKRGDKIGVAAMTMNRVGRELGDLVEILKLCQIHGVPLFLDGRVYDAQDDLQLLTMHVSAVFAHHSLSHQRAYMNRCRVAKAKLGKIVGKLPPGIIKQQDGRPARERDTPASEAIEKVFREFRKRRSIAGTVAALAAEGVFVPVRSLASVEFRAPDINRVSRIVKNPLYGGRYVFRKNVADAKLGQDSKGHWRTRRAREDEQVLSDLSFESYISWHEFEENQEILRQNDPSKGKRRPTENPSLLQGLIRHVAHPACSMSPKRLNPRKDGTCGYSYECPGAHRHGGEFCFGINTRHLDAIVLTEVVSRIARPRIEAIRRAYEQARGDAHADRFRLEVELRRAREEEGKMKRLYLSEAAENEEVRRELSAVWAAAIRGREALERRVAEEPRDATSVFDAESRFTRFVELCSDIHRLVELALPVECKRLVRALVDTVWIEHYSPQRLVAKIVWKDGSPDALLERNLWGEAYDRISAMTASGSTAAEVARALAADGLLTAHGLPWTERLVHAVLERDRQGVPRTRGRRPRAGTEPAACSP